jgi:hypothetical protein
MIDNIEIKETNIRPHTDIEREMGKVRNNWFHFELRIANENIVDFVMREYITYEKLEQK